MMTYDAPGAGAENAVMASIMPGDSADGGTLQAASRLCSAAIEPIKRAKAAGNNMDFI
jgi:hypothetical protein